MEESKDLSVIFHEKLREKMIEEGLSVEQLSERSKVPRSSVGRYTKPTGASVPPVDAAVNLARALGLSVEYLCGFPTDVSDKEIEAYAADKTGLSVASMSVIRELSHAQFDHGGDELVLYDPWQICRGQYYETGYIPLYDEKGFTCDYVGTPEKNLIFDGFPYEITGKQLLEQIFSADNSGLITDLLSLLAKYIFLNYLNQQSDIRDKKERAWLADNADFKYQFTEESFAEYKSTLQSQVSINRYNIFYKFQQLVDAVAGSFPVDSKYDDFLDQAYYDIHDVVADYVWNTKEARRELESQDSDDDE